MTRISNYIFQSDDGQTLNKFVEELYIVYDILGRDIVGVYNNVLLDVNQYENPMSLYWQYLYKREMKKYIS